MEPLNLRTLCVAFRLTGKGIHGAPGFKLSDAISTTDKDFYANNGVGYVEVKKDILQFAVLDKSGATIIYAELPLK